MQMSVRNGGNDWKNIFRDTELIIEAMSKGLSREYTNRDAGGDHN